MSEKNWGRMFEIFHAAVETAPDRVAAFLDSSCGDDGALRERIDGMLAAHDKPDPIFDEGGGRAALDFEDLHDPLIGRRIGPYEIVDVIGEGGMGIVYEARQTEPERRVALKLIRLGMDTAEVVARFAAERQALALMTHGSIAKVFDGGATEQGRPYFVMELVEGTPITRYCDHRALSIDARVELFLDVCDGVRHAHQRGIIHRDLKPSNLLITEDDGRPVPKIIDFGIAKATGRRLTEQTAFTAMGAWVGTPEYMSPEQVDESVADVDTRSDVYSLGVLLYELLVGVLPFDPDQFHGAGISAIRRLIVEEEPALPSARLASSSRATAASAAAQRGVDAATLQRRVAGDLDWIVMKALEKDPERRYGSVAELAEDIRRHLRNDPVDASPPSTAYRVAKFVRRHRAGSTFAAAVAVLLLAFGVTMAVLANRIATERDRATLEARTSQQVTDFLLGLFNVSNPGEARGNTITAREILDRGAGEIRAQLADEPAVQARMMHAIARVYNQLGLYGPAGELAESALEIRRRTLGPDDIETIGTMSLLADTLGETGDYPAALALIDEALRLVEGRAEPDDQVAGDTLLTSAHVLGWMGRYAEAREAAERAAAHFEAAYGEDHPRTLDALADAGSEAGFMGDFEEAKRLQLRVLAALEAQLGPDDPALDDNINNLAITYWQLGDYEGGRPYFERALRMAEANYGEQHARTAASLNNMGRLLTDMEEFDEAGVYLDRAIAAWTAAVGSDHPETARALLNKGSFLATTGDLDGAIVLYERGLAIREEKLGVQHPETLMAIDGFAAVLRRAGYPQRADEYERRAAAIRRELDAS